MGGVLTDLDGRTTLPGLYAAGEVASTGVHGANRLASNSLLEGLVFGARSARAMRRYDGDAWPFQSAVEYAAEGQALKLVDGTSTPSFDEVRELMWQQVGLFRDRDGLSSAVDTLERSWRGVTQAILARPSSSIGKWRYANLLTVARLIARAALRREESRGAHYRDDCPQRDDIHWKRRLADRLSSAT
jgi:L-aspartate oxidase